MKDTPLSCAVVNDMLIIKIGISTLAWAAKNENGGVLDENEKIINELEFSNDVARALCKEDEVGNTILQNSLDLAIGDAVDTGSTAIDCLKIKKQ